MNNITKNALEESLKKFLLQKPLEMCIRDRYSGPYPGGNEAGRRAAYACTEFLCGEDDRDGAVGKAYYNVIY